MTSFLSRFGDLIRFVLSGFDRLRFRGESRFLSNNRGVDNYLYQQKIKHVDFPDYAESLTKSLCRDTERQAEVDRVVIKHLNSPQIDKEAVALEIARERGLTSGRVALLSSVELGSVYRLRKSKETGWVAPRKEIAKCLHYYHYFLHPQLGLCYVRVQSWFPFVVRVGLNGRQWLYRQLENRGIPFQRKGNLLLSVGSNSPQDFDQAQDLLDTQRHTDWPTLFRNLVRPIQPLWDHLENTLKGPHNPYHWIAEQSEWATDYLFRRPEDLALWYPLWIKHGTLTLQCKDVLRYLGKKVSQNSANGYGNCTGEAKIDLRARPEGTRLKFWYTTNSIKCYDKEKIALRIETTINSARGFRVFRTKENQPADAPKGWHQLRKGVADMDRRAEISQSSNNRLAESLSTVAEPNTLGKLLKPLGEPVMSEGKRVARPLNPLTGVDGDLLRALSQGEFLIQGFRNRDLRKLLFGEATKDDRRRQAAAVTRKLTLLKRHGLIIKTPNSHRYHHSALGRRIASALQSAYDCDLTHLTRSA